MAQRVALREGETLIGRAPACDVVVNVPSVSRQHARLKVAGSRCTLTDAGSTYGTFVAGVPVKADTEITPGDVFQCGSILFTLEQAQAAGVELSESHQVLQDSGAIVRQVGTDGPRAADRTVQAEAARMPAAPVPAPPPPAVLDAGAIAIPVGTPGPPPDAARG